jgi:hypothetical protein
MDAPRSELPLLPVTCTLGAIDGAAQLQRWCELNDRALVRCAFLDWQVERREDELRLHVRGPAAELDTLDLR